MTKYPSGSYFAWGDTLFHAIESTVVTRSSIKGEAYEIIQFLEDCTEEDAETVCRAFGADTTYLRLPAVGD